MDITTIAGLTVALLAFAVLGAFVLSRRRGREEAPEADEPAPAPSTRRRSLRSDASLDEPMFDQALAGEPVIAHVSLDEPAIDHPVLGQMTASELLHAIAESNAPPPPPAGPRPDAIDAARRHPIVFRTLLPQGPGKDGLSFFGGQPIGPEGFQWPRRHGSEGQPLTFMMQWDCEALAAQDKSGLLPTDGVLYCFIDLEWGKGDPGSRIEAFLHHPGPTEGWSEIPLPADAPPIFGGDYGARYVTACTEVVDNAADHVPRTMPRFPFEPLGFDYPQIEVDDDEDTSHLFWDERAAGEAQLAVAKSGRPPEPLGAVDPYPRSTGRPFASFPHDFGAIRVIATKMIKDVTFSRYSHAPRANSDLSAEDHEALAETCLAEAKELYRLGCQRPMDTALEQQIADDIWQWLESRKDFIRYGFDDMVVEAVGLSLGVGSRALDRVPAEWVERAMRGHALASEYLTHEYFDAAKHGDWAEYERLKKAGEIPLVRKVHANVPAHMFGPPSYVQGDVEELVHEQVLLLELPSGSTPGLAIGEGVLQYMIRPEDLAARRFDRVESVISGY